MSKISVTTIAGLTSGGDANTVKIESGDAFNVVSGATTLGGDLTVDTSTLKVNSSTNLVGIGTASPTSALHVSGGAGTNVAIQSSAGTHWRIGDGVGSTNGNLVIYDYTDSRKVFEIDTLGRLTIPNQPSFFVGATGQTAATNEITSWGSGNVKHNIGSHFSESSGRFTAPVAGRYFFAFNSLQNGNGNQMTAMIRVNSGNLAIYVRTDGDSSEHHHTSGSGIFNLAANDYVSIYVTGGSAYGDTSTYWTSFHGHLLS